MAKKRKGKKKQVDPTPAKVPERLSTPFADAMKQLKQRTAEEVASNKPSAEGQQAGVSPAQARRPPRNNPDNRPNADPKHDYETAVALRNAYAGVKRLDDGKPERVAGTAPTPKRVPVRLDEDDAKARQRLATLVSGGIRFTVEREPEFVRGFRSESGDGVLSALKHGRAVPDDQIDLHGLRADGANAQLVRFLRRAKNKGYTVVLVIHGKGTHSHGGVGVLGDAVVECLSEGAGAPFVLGFMTPSLERGGHGALLVRIA